MKERPEVTIRDGNCINSRVAVMLNMSNIPLALTSQFRLNRVAASVFNESRSDCLDLEWSSSAIGPNLLVYQCLNIGR